MECECTLKVDVIIPTYRPGESFQVLMQLLCCQSYPIHQIIIMNTGNNLPLEDRYRRYCEEQGIQMRVYHLPKSEFDHGGTRNLGVSHSQADIFIMMTQDAVPKDRRLVWELVSPFLEDPYTAVSYARQLPNLDCRFLEAYTRSFNYPKTSARKTREDLSILGIKTYFSSNVCAAYSREIFDRLDGFEEKTIFNEDMLYAAKAIQTGYSVFYQAEAEVFHSHNYTGMQQLHRNFDLAVSQKQHPEVFKGVRSESEGMRLVKDTAAYVCRKKKPWLLPELFWISGWKYIGYFLGKRYDKLPGGLVKWLSMNKEYWKEI